VRLALGLLALTALAGERKSIFPPGVKPVGPYSPGVQVGDFLYVSGQGARDAAGQLPAGIDAQTKQCLENVKTIIEAGGLKMENIVYTQVYLSDMANYEAMNRVYESYFSKDKPARAMIGVKRMPTDTPVEISAVATTNAGKRVYLPGILGHRGITNHVPSDYKAEARQAFDEASSYLGTKKLKLSDLAFTNIYYTAEMPADFVKTLADKYMKTVVLLPVNSLPLGANIEITGIAGQPDVYSVHTGTTQQVLEAIQKDLKTAGLTMENIVVSNVYIDDIDNFATMNKTYASFFTKAPPTRTTVQPVTGARSNTISVIAIK
jgi:2-iminobutanoate/2-iminopropanoate deaminase